MENTLEVKEVQTSEEVKQFEEVKKEEFDFLDDELINEKKRILEEQYSYETGDRIKILSNEPYIEDLLKKYYDLDEEFVYELPKVGDVVDGVVVGETSKYVLVDAGYKDYIYIEKKGKELNALMSAGLLEGHEVEVMIKSVKEKNYSIIGSIDMILQRKAAELLEEGIFEDRIFMGHIKEFTAAGYLVTLDVDGFESDVFMPKTLAGINKLPDPESIVGKTLEVMVENRTNEGYIVSRKKFLKTLIKDKIAAMGDIKVTDEDVIEMAKEVTTQQFMMYGLPANDEQITQFVMQNVLKKEEDVRQYQERSLEKKVTAFLKESLKLDSKEVTIEEFNKIVNPEPEVKEEEIVKTEEKTESEK